MDIDDVIKFLCDHNIRLIAIDQDKNEVTITERYGSVTTFQIDMVGFPSVDHTLLFLPPTRANFDVTEAV